MSQNAMPVGVFKKIIELGAFRAIGSFKPRGAQLPNHPDFYNTY